jgi:hypothetical protein
MALAACAAFFVLIGGVLLWLAYADHKRMNELAASGVTVDATITKREVQRARSNLYYVTFQFESPAEDSGTALHSWTQNVSPQTFRELVEGSRVVVKYLPRDPARTAKLWGAYADNTAFEHLKWVGLGFTVGGILLLGMAWIRIGEDTAKAAATSAVTLTAAAELNEIRAAVDKRLANWKQVTDREPHWISPAEVGLRSSPDLKEIVYGYCDGGNFYVFVFKTLQALQTGSIGRAYRYSAEPGQCAPEYWSVVNIRDLGGGWSFALVYPELPATATVSPQ